MIESFDRSSKTCFSSFLPQPACGIHLCSPECYNAHVFDGARLGGRPTATFLTISKFKDKKSNANKSHRTAAE